METRSSWSSNETDFGGLDCGNFSPFCSRTATSAHKRRWVGFLTTSVAVFPLEDLIRVPCFSTGPKCDFSFPTSVITPWAADVCIVGAVRTPFGAFQGSLASVPATHLGGVAIKGIHAQSGACNRFTSIPISSASISHKPVFSSA